jgi:pyruvate kinase
MNNLTKTKIICTLGPASDNNDSILEQMILAGMNVARINCSHATHEQVKRRADSVKRASQKLDIPVALMLDTKGPDIRLGEIEGGSVTLETGSSFTLTTHPHIGNCDKAHVNYENLPQEINVGTNILIDDGLVKITVVDKNEHEIFCQVVVGGPVGSKKSVNVPAVKLNIPFIREKDYQDILYAIENDFDFIAVSFARKAEDVLEVKKILSDNNSDMQIIAKIENFEGVENIDEILEVSDGIMVARGDLGVEIPFEEIPALQKSLLKQALNAGKISITATQMLESMINSPRPTRAEITDVANAIYDGTGAIMLSGETAMGKYPVETIKTMATIARKTEDDINYIAQLFLNRPYKPFKITEAIGHAACTIAHDINASAIITITITGTTALEVSKYRASCPIIAFTSSPKTMNHLCMSWGVVPVYLENVTGTDDLLHCAIEKAVAKGLINKDDRVVATAGLPLGVAGSTNMLKVVVA